MFQSNTKKDQEHNKETTKTYTLVRQQKLLQKSPTRKRPQKPPQEKPN